MTVYKTEIDPQHESINEIYLCDCASDEHTIKFWADNEYKELFIIIHLSTWRNFWKRLVYAVKYLFGYTSKYGAFDSIILTLEDAEELSMTLSKWLEQANGLESK